MNNFGIIVYVNNFETFNFMERKIRIYIEHDCLWYCGIDVSNDIYFPLNVKEVLFDIKNFELYE